MSKFIGGFITKSPVAPTTSAASGVWTLSQAMQYNKAGIWPSAGGAVVATGGTITTATIGGIAYKIHTFTTVGANQFIASSGGEIEVFLLGGGGGGGMLGGGGGGGGIIVAKGIINAATYNLTVGDGGAGVVGWTNSGTAGGSSAGFGMTALGGGCGYYYSGSANSNNQGVANNGGYAYNITSGATLGTMSLASGWTGTIYGGTTGNGKIGGSPDPSCCSCRGGGGGGAGANGGAYNAGAGGIGVQINFDGNNYYWAGGGGNDGYCSNTGGSGGAGGGGGGGGATGGVGGGSARSTGGTGVSSNGNANGGAGGANTGGGGGAGSNGGGSSSIVGGKGGSGIIMIRYKV